MKGDKKLEIQTPDVPPCDFCGEASGVRCLVESAARYCPDAPTLDQIVAHERQTEDAIGVFKRKMEKYAGERTS